LSSYAYVDFYLLATIYAGFGEKDEAFQLLEKGYEQRSASMPSLAVDPFWSEMSSDPLLRRPAAPHGATAVSSSVSWATASLAFH
jgi:hypothetical protein